MKEVSVIVPVYNAEKYIEECLLSLLSFDNDRLEILLIDDGSTDNSYKICSDYEKAYDCIKVWSQKNAGVSAARNQGLRNATADYVMFVDSDDFIDGRMIELGLEKIKESDFCVCGFSLYDDINREKVITYPCSDFVGSAEKFARNIEDYLSPPYLLGPVCKIFKRKIILDNNLFFPLEFSYGEDAIFVFKYLTYAKKITSFTFDGYSYRQHGNESLCTKFREELLDNEVIVNKYIFFFLEKNGVENAKLICTKRFTSSFATFMRRMMFSGLKHKEKRELFVKKANQYDMCNLYKKVSCKSWAEKITYIVLLNERLFPILYLHNLKKILSKI